MNTTKTKSNLRFNNTYESGSVTFLIILERKKYKGVCLEFDLTVEADSFQEAKRLIEDYAKVWHKNAVVHKLPEEVLNRPAPKKYWQIYRELVEQDLKKLEAERQGFSKDDIEPTAAIRLQSSYPGFAFS